MLGKHICAALINLNFPACVCWALTTISWQHQILNFPSLHYNSSYCRVKPIAREGPKVSKIHWNTQGSCHLRIIHPRFVFNHQKIKCVTHDKPPLRACFPSSFDDPSWVLISPYHSSGDFPSPVIPNILGICNRNDTIREYSGHVSWDETVVRCMYSGCWPCMLGWDYNMIGWERERVFTAAHQHCASIPPNASTRVVPTIHRFLKHPNLDAAGSTVDWLSSLSIYPSLSHVAPRKAVDNVHGILEDSERHPATRLVKPKCPSSPASPCADCASIQASCAFKASWHLPLGVNLVAPR